MQVTRFSEAPLAWQAARILGADDSEVDALAAQIEADPAIVAWLASGACGLQGLDRAHAIAYAIEHRAPLSEASDLLG